MKNASEERLRASARLAVLAGTGAMVGTAFGQDAAPAAAGTEDKAVELDKVSVTGSRIRRVDTETASPVFVIDRATIERSGVT
ncbi:MAG TPA: hypothetical protein VJM11_19360, partial [Nevskiaceae bacterium]|nr:hypothetical protein [Nevskiaceae bacterium]